MINIDYFWLICIIYATNVNALNNENEFNNRECSNLSFTSLNNSMSIFPMFARGRCDSVEQCAYQCYNVSICFASNFMENGGYCELMSNELDGPYDNETYPMINVITSTYISNVSCHDQMPSRNLSRKKRWARFELDSWMNPRGLAESATATSTKSMSEQQKIAVDLDYKCGAPVVQPRVSVTSLSKGLFRIVGGTDAAPHSWPWQVSVQTESGFHFCGGTLIHSKYVLTAGHCMLDHSMNDMRVVLGAHDLSMVNEVVQKRTVSNVEVHPDFQITPDAIYNDFALLTLKEEVNFTDYVKPVCINAWRPPGGVQCIVTGWGVTRSGSRVTSKILQQVVLPLYNNSQCNDAKHYHGLIDDSVVCAGLEEGGKDSCQGDSGGPLTCYDLDSKKWYLIGSVSYGDDCAVAFKPGVYARVAYGLDWIVQHLK